MSTIETPGALAPFAPRELGEGLFKLHELARALRPRWYHVWLLSADCGSATHGASRAEAAVAREWPDLPEWKRFAKEIEYRNRRAAKIARRRRAILQVKISP